ncbi:MAG: hypothetical protein AB1791_11575 [Chloroflexota bacterium]
MRRLLQNPHKTAAVTYASLGAVVIALTLVAGLTPAGRPNAAVELGIGLVFVVIFAILLYRGWWPLAAPLVFSNTWRAFTYLNDGLGRHVELLPFSVTPITPRPVAFVNAALMVVIVGMLGRAAWLGFRVWRTQRGMTN